MQTDSEQNQIMESPPAPSQSPSFGVSLEVNPETPNGVCVSDELKLTFPTQDISKILSSILSEIVSQRDTLNSQGKMLKSLKEEEEEYDDESEGEEDESESEGEEEESEEEEILDVRWKTINKLLDSHLEVVKAVNQLISEE